MGDEFIGDPGLRAFPRQARQPRRIERADGAADECQIVRGQRQQRHARLPMFGEEPLHPEGREQAAHVQHGLYRGGPENCPDYLYPPPLIGKPAKKGAGLAAGAFFRTVIASLTDAT